MYSSTTTNSDSDCKDQSKIFCQIYLILNGVAGCGKQINGKQVSGICRSSCNMCQVSYQCEDKFSFCPYLSSLYGVFDIFDMNSCSYLLEMWKSIYFIQ